MMRISDWSSDVFSSDLAGGLFRAAAEQELLHFGFEEAAVLRVQRREPVLVDQHGLVRQPRRPAGLADVGEHALAQFSGPGHEIQALGVLVLVLAVHRAPQVDGTAWACRGGAYSCGVTGAGM